MAAEEFDAWTSLSRQVRLVEVQRAASAHIALNFVMQVITCQDYFHFNVKLSFLILFWGISYAWLLQKHFAYCRIGILSHKIVEKTFGRELIDFVFSTDR